MLLVLFFFAAQLAGLLIINQYIEDFEKPHFLNCFDFQSRRCANNKLLFSEGYSKFSIDHKKTAETKEVVMKGLMLEEALLTGFLKTLIIPVFASLAFLILLLKGQQNKFYPAMPVLSLGCVFSLII